MAINIKSLQVKLLKVAKEKRIEFQLLLNQFGAEQFLARLSLSPVAEKFIFKGGTLLTYLIKTDRKTKDLDFLIKQISNEVEELIKVIQSIQEIPLEDGITWGKIQGGALSHFDMEYPGARIACHFHLGQMKGRVRMDFALGDVVEAVKFKLPKVRYKGEPLVGQDFHLLTYPPETIFSEKLHTALAKKEGNTRMKDYYDLFKLSHSPIRAEKLKKEIHSTFGNREMEVVERVQFDQSITDQLQIYWSRFRTRQKLHDSPEDIAEII